MATTQFNLYTLSGCEAFIQQSTPNQIAQVLRLDQECVRGGGGGGGFPTLLIHLLPPLKSKEADEIARALYDVGLPPEPESKIEDLVEGVDLIPAAAPVVVQVQVKVPLVIARLQYTSIVQSIRTHLATLTRSPHGASLDDLAFPPPPNANPTSPSQNPTPTPTSSTHIRFPSPSDIPSHLIPTDNDFNSTLKVLTYLQLPIVKEINVHTTLTDILKAVQTHLGFGEDVRWARMTSDTYPISNIPPKNKSKSQSQSPSQSNSNSTTTTTTTTPKPHINKPRVYKPFRKPRLCYICQFRLTATHPLYPSLCPPCGSFNLSSSSLSLPPSLSLLNKTALVTGGRINLGYHVVLRLLRCGARVICTTRYPLDAKERFGREPEAKVWLEEKKLRIVGADFRSAKDVFGLVCKVKEVLEGEWGVGKLDILVNNAAQTLTDSVEKERVWIEKEGRAAQEEEEEARRVKATLRREDGEDREGRRGFVVDHDYKPRVRGGVDSNLITYERERMLVTGSSIQTIPDHVESTQSTTIDSADAQSNDNTDAPSNDNVDTKHNVDTTKHNVDTTKHNENTSHQILLSKPAEKSSWMQNIDEIPYEDVISAHSVNTFVPLILLRELVPLMGRAKGSTASPAPSNSNSTGSNSTGSTSTSSTSTSSTSTSTSTPTQPQTQTRNPPAGYIINISSRESLPERTPSHSSKAGHHVHTNMSKAALNMLTETEAGVTWRNWRVSVNSVDPGYMSADKEWMEYLGERQRRGKAKAKADAKAKASAKGRARGNDDDDDDDENQNQNQNQNGEGEGASKQTNSNLDQDQDQDQDEEQEQEQIGHQGIPFCPLGWEDGAGRVLWVVAKGEREGVCVWGRFLKHFESVHSGR